MREQEQQAEQFEGQRNEAGRRTEAECGWSVPPRIYVASLADYNAGRLHGQWISAAQDPGELHEAVQAMLASSSEPIAEEWAIHDYEGFGPVALAEYASFDTVSTLAMGIEKHGLAFAALASLMDNDAEQLDRFEELYRGEWDSLEAYAEQWLADVGASDMLDGIPQWLQPYVHLDTSGFARDLQLGGDIQAVPNPDGGIWIFDGQA